MKANAAESCCLLSCRYMRTGGRASRITSLQVVRTVWWPLPMRMASGTTCPATTTCPTSARKAQVLKFCWTQSVTKSVPVGRYLSEAKLNQFMRREDVCCLHTVWLLVCYSWPAGHLLVISDHHECLRSLCRKDFFFTKCQWLVILHQLFCITCTFSPFKGHGIKCSKSWWWTQT